MWQTDLTVSRRLSICSVQGEAGGRENKTENRSYFPGLSRKLPPAPHLGLALFLKLSSLRVQLLSRSARQQKRSQDWEEWKRKKNTGPISCLSRRESGWYLPSEITAHADRHQFREENCGKTLISWLWPCTVEGWRHIWLLLYTAPNLCTAFYGVSFSGH